MTAPEPTQPLTDEELASMRSNQQHLSRVGGRSLTAYQLDRLLAEVDRLRAELAEMETDRDKYQNWYDAAVDDLREVHLSRNEDAALGLDQDGRGQA